MAAGAGVIEGAVGPNGYQPLLGVVADLDDVVPPPLPVLVSPVAVSSSFAFSIL
jgi:hypothetical protein